MNEEKELKQGDIVIYSWMVDLRLSSNELLLYALIYKHSFDENLHYLNSADCVKKLPVMSRRTVFSCLKNLWQKGLITKTHLSDDEISKSMWYAPEKSYQKARISMSIRKQVFERDAYRCKHCGTWKDLTVDHIIPESKGGALDLDNLQTLCRSCNSKKGTR